MHLKDGLGDIQTDRRNLSHGRLSQSWPINSHTMALNDAGRGPSTPSGQCLPNWGHSPHQFKTEEGSLPTQMRYIEQGRQSDA